MPGEQTPLPSQTSPSSPTPSLQEMNPMPFTDDLDLDHDYDAQDDRDAELADSARALVFGLPARPGTRR